MRRNLHAKLYDGVLEEQVTGLAPAPQLEAVGRPGAKTVVFVKGEFAHVQQKKDFATRPQMEPNVLN